MISKRIGIAPKNDNYACLAAYIADAGHAGEKSLMNWCAGCLGGDDYAEGIAEVQDTQAMNTRSGGSKTYHMIVSFRPEDEKKLTPEVFLDIEKRFAAALGYSDHQRHCGVHKNTDNIHMHIAYNMVHSEKHTRYKEFRDYWIRDKLCRELERKYGLVIDNGRERAIPDQQHPQRLGEKSALVEAHTGQQSFESYAKEQRTGILQVLAAAKSWQDLHEVLAHYGLEIKPHGNGLAVKDRHSERAAHAMKASALDRSLSQKKLEARLGVYVPPQNLEQLREHSRYEATPLHRSPERGKMFAEYRAGIETRKATLQTVKEQEAAALAAIRAEWEAKRRELEQKSLDKRKRQKLLQLARKYETEALAKARLLFQEPREAVRREVPYTSWNAFLQHEAIQGNETALAALRSTKESAELERGTPVAPTKDWSQHGMDQSALGKAKIKAEFATRELAVLESTDTTAKGKTRLLAVLRMERIAEEERLQGNSPIIAGYRHSVDRKGTVIFTMPSGGTIRDSGKELFFSVHDKAAETAAMCYAQAKWGKSIQMEGNRICRKEIREPQRGVER